LILNWLKIDERKAERLEVYAESIQDDQIYYENQLVERAFLDSKVLPMDISLSTPRIDE
jgi:hypothetical protein